MGQIIALWREYLAMQNPEGRAREETKVTSLSQHFTVKLSTGAVLGDIGLSSLFQGR